MATYYIDYDGGSDANNGTSKATPWKHHPYMRQTGPTYTHVAGDIFVFKGGVTWPNTALPLYIAKGGSSTSVRDKYTVDETWYSGGAWTRPVFDAQSTALAAGKAPAARGNVIWVKGSSSKTVGAHIEITGLEIKNHIWTDPVPTSNTDGLAIYLDSTDDIIVTNVYAHDWVIQSTSGSDFGGFLQYNSTNTSAINCTIQAPTVIEAIYCDNSGRTSGAGIEGFTIVDGCEIIGTTQGVWSCRIVRNSIIRDGGNNYQSVVHENGVWATGHCDFYNNKVLNWHSGVGAYFLVGWSGSNRVQKIYNNIFENTPQINLTNQAAVDTTNTIYFANNTVVSSLVQIGTTKAGSAFGKLRVQNNHYITNGTAVSVLDAADLGADYVNSNNLTTSTATATGLGMTSLNSYKPISSVTGLVNAGLDYSAHFTFDHENNARPVGPSYDIGAYEYGATEPEEPPVEPEPPETPEVPKIRLRISPLAP